MEEMHYEEAPGNTSELDHGIAPTEHEEVGVPTGKCNGCADRESVSHTLERELSPFHAKLDELAQKVTELSGTVAGLGRQQQVLTEHQKQVASQQNWMATEVQKFVAMIPEAMAGIPGIGKMMTKKLGGASNGEG